MRLPRVSDRTAAAALAAVVPAFALLWPILARGTLPAFNHDWNWPPDASAAWGAFVSSARPFTDGNFGALNYYMGSAPANFIVAAFVAAFGSILGLKVLLFCILAGASIGAFVFSGRLGASTLGSAACALAYAGSPVVANELAAGHIAYLFAYALLPAIAACGLAIARAPRLLHFAALLPLCTIAVAQPQFAFFEAAVLLACLPFCRAPRAVIALGGAAAIALCVSPFEIAAAIAGHPLSGLHVDLTTLHWEAANSAPLRQSFFGSGYGPHYDEAAPRALLFLREIAAAVFWLACIAAVLRRPRCAALLAIALAAALAVAGVNGPLAPVLALLFTHVPQSALFRELYHFSALVLLGMTAISACAASRRLSGVVALAAIAFVLAQCTGGFWHFTGRYDPAGIARVDRILARDTRNGGVLYWPLLQPMGPSDAHAGADPDAFPVGAHWTIAEFMPVQPLSQIGLLICQPHADVRTLLEQLGIRWVVIRPGWTSQYFTRIEPDLQPLVRHAPSPGCGTRRLLRALPVVYRGRSHVLARVPNPKAFANTSFTAPFYRLPIGRAATASRAGVDPRRGWVDGTRWQWWNPAFLGPVNPGVFTLGRTAYELPHSDGAQTIVANAPGGLALLGRVPRFVRPHAGYAAISIPAGDGRVVARGPAMLAGTASTRPRGPRGRACARVERERGEFRILAAGCPRIAVEAIALPSSGWSLTARDGTTLAPLPDAWDDRWNVAASAAPLRLHRDLPFALSAGVAAQYGEWGVSCFALIGLMICRCFIFFTRRNRTSCASLS